MVDDPYRFAARLYDAIFEPMNHGLRLLGLRMYVPPRGAAVLDVGCGTGSHLAVYQRFGCRLHGIDHSPGMLAQARARLGHAADLRLGDARELPYSDDSFNLVIAMLALHEMEPEMRSAVLGEMKRVMALDGRMLLIDFHPGRPTPGRGWLTRVIIWCAEIAAGPRHFRNYRRFISSNGLSPLITHLQLAVERRRVVDGSLTLILLSK